MQEKLKTAKKFLIKGKIEEAILLLLDIFYETPSVQRDVVLTSSRFHLLENKYGAGLIDYKVYESSSQQIILKLLGIIYSHLE